MEKSGARRSCHVLLSVGGECVELKDLNGVVFFQEEVCGDINNLPKVEY